MLVALQLVAKRREHEEVLEALGGQTRAIGSTTNPVIQEIIKGLETRASAALEEKKSLEAALAEARSVKVWRQKQRWRWRSARIFDRRFSLTCFVL